MAKKRKSKRVKLQQKYKIQKRTKQHHKRIKKGVLVGKMRKKLVDTGIPNAFPYKAELLKEIQVAKERMEEVRLRQKEQREQEIMKRRTGKDKTVNDMEVDEQDNRKQKNVLSAPNDQFIEDNNVEVDEGMDVKGTNLGQNSRRAYLRELRKVVTGADVILQVLDARDPVGTCSKAVEEMVLADSRKKLVYVLNKADLVPRDVLAGWLKYLRRTHPAIPFKCNTQNQKGNLGQAVGKVSSQQESALKTNQAIGAEELIGLLKNYARIGDSKSIISVGCVGFPNVGKSSLINSLMRTRAVGVSSTPGFTKVAQEVILDKNIRLIDSPGIVFADGDSAATALRNCVNVEELVDILTPIQAILERCPQGYLMELYGIPKFKAQDCMSFLALVAKATGKLKKGGIPNTDAAARSVLHDWNNGKIKFYCKAPVIVNDNGGAGEADTKIVSSFSKSLDINSLRDEDIRVLDALEAASMDVETPSSNFVPVDNIAGSLDTDLADSSVADKMVTSTAAVARVSKEKTKKVVLTDESAPVIDSRKLQKNAKKKSLKDERRAQSNADSAMDEDYDFDADFH